MEQNPAKFEAAETTLGIWDSCMQNNSTERYFTPQIKTNNFHYYVFSVLGPLVANTGQHTSREPQSRHSLLTFGSRSCLPGRQRGKAGTEGNPTSCPSRRASRIDTVKKPVPSQKIPLQDTKGIMASVTAEASLLIL